MVAAGSLSAAARALGTSPAMVSKRIAAMEARLGTRLLHRTTRQLALTPLGERFHDDVLGILAAAAAAEARLAGAGQPLGPLRLSAPTSFGRLHIAPHLRPFLEAHPQVMLSLDLSDDYVDLVRARIDCAIRITHEVEPGLAAHRLATSHRILCAAPHYLDRHGTPATIGELKNHSLLAADGQSPWKLAGPAETAQVPVASMVRTNSSEVVRELAIAGAGIALRSLWDVGRELAQGTLVRVLPDWAGSADVAIYAIHPRSSHVPAQVVSFINYLTQLYAQPRWEAPDTM